MDHGMAYSARVKFVKSLSLGRSEGKCGTERVTCFEDGESY